jgi:hypothetical protein
MPSILSIWRAERMTTPRILFALSLLFLLGPALATSAASASEDALKKEARLALIWKAQIRTPTQVSAMDLRAGPPGSDALPLDETLRCTYVETKLTGSSRKFDCAIGKSDVAKVKYGANNGEVVGSVLASRLLWALGFGADRVYPVRVTCQGCSSDPWTKRKAVQEPRRLIRPRSSATTKDTKSRTNRTRGGHGRSLTSSTKPTEAHPGLSGMHSRCSPSLFSTPIANQNSAHR